MTQSVLKLVPTTVGKTTPPKNVIFAQTLVNIPSTITKLANNANLDVTKNKQDPTSANNVQRDTFPMSLIVLNVLMVKVFWKIGATTV
jgi:hypothetical protein